MAIQIRRGTNTEWESNNSNIVVGEPAIATDAERFFVGTASGDYAEFANLDIIAPAYDTSTLYVVGDVINRQGKLYSCNTPCSGAFNVSYWDEKSLAEILKDLENEIDYAQYEVGHASGKLVSISNGAGGIPVKDLTLDIEAVQDLHGYDHPWVGGAGKNLLPIVNTPTYSGLTIIKNNDGSYTISGKPNSNGSIEFYNDALNPIRITEPCIFTSEWNPQNSATIIFSTAESSTALQTSTSDTLNIPIGEYTRFRIYVNSANTYNFTFKPMLRLASVSDATFEPYSNICPISGWDEVNVNVQQKNFLKTRVASGVNSGITWSLNADGTATVSGTATSTVVIPLLTSSQSDNILYLPSGTYKISGGGGTGYWVGIYFNAVTGSWAATTTGRQQFTAEFGDYVAPCIRIGRGTSFNTPYTFYPMISLASVDDTFEPYNGQTYTIDLDGTRYGGSLDATTGVLTVTHGFVTLDGTVNWTMGTTTNFRYFDAIMGALNTTAWDTNVVSNMFNQQGTYPYAQIGGSKKIRVCYSINDTSVTTVAQLQALLTQNALQVLYQLATPQVVQLTAEQVRTVLGTNNLWNQMNSNNELAYRISNALN